MKKSKYLKSIDFKKNWIYEVLVTTTDDRKEPNTAPMGISTSDFKNLKLEVYKNSQTCKNIFSQREFVVNFVDDIMLFYNSSLSEKKLKYKNAEKINAPVLSSANSWLEVKLIYKKDLEDKLIFTGKIVHSKINKKIALINRAKFLCLESLIKVTKLPFSEKKEFLKKEIFENFRVVKKVAPNSKYEKIMKKILRREILIK